MKRKTVIILACAFILSALLGCDKISSLLKIKPKQETKEKQVAYVTRGTIIAKVNNIPITLEVLNRYIDVYNASLELREDLAPEQKKEAKIDTREKKLNYLKERLVRQAAFYQAALDRGLDRKDEIVELLERSRIEILAAEMENEIVKNIDVSSAEIEEAYKNNKSLFREPETRKLREVVFKSDDEARQALVELLQGGDFAALARNRSIADSAKNGGDLGALQKGQRGEEFANFDEVAFSPALQKDAISSVFKGPNGYYIVKVEDIKGGKQISLSEAWDSLKLILLNRKQEEALDKFYAELSRQARIEVYEGEIK